VIPSGDSALDFHILLKGRVQVVHYAKSGREVRLYEFGEGQPFGGFEMVDEPSITLQAIAAEDTTALRFRDWSVFDAAGIDPDFAAVILGRTTNVASHLARRLIELTVERAQDRIRLELVREARRNMVDGHTGRIERAPTHVELAARVGSQREVVTREMNSLRRRGLVEKTGRTLFVRVDGVEALLRNERPRVGHDTRVRRPGQAPTSNQ